jgi:hypothetical protein
VGFGVAKGGESSGVFGVSVEVAVGVKEGDVGCVVVIGLMSGVDGGRVNVELLGLVFVFVL